MRSTKPLRTFCTTSVPSSSKDTSSLLKPMSVKNLAASPRSSVPVLDCQVPITFCIGFGATSAAASASSWRAWAPPRVRYPAPAADDEVPSVGDKEELLSLKY